MTTVSNEKVRCAVCGAENEYPSVASTNRFGSPDLDSRPPEMERSTIFAWVQRCPGCGYCATDVSEARAEAPGRIRTAEYQTQLSDPGYPELANSFLCKAIIDRESNAFAAATWAIIHAAWTCDDLSKPDQAASCRRKAAEMMATAAYSGQQISEQEGASTAMLIDLLRRSGQIEQARQVLKLRRSGITNPVIARVLDFQSHLLAKNDLSGHTIEEALKQTG
jgi:uncharacterized protein (DUF2225 family)